MKKFLVLLAALALVFAFVACSDDDDGLSSSSSSSVSSNSSSSSGTGSSKVIISYFFSSDYGWTDQGYEKFIELYNAGTAAQDLTGWSLQYSYAGKSSVGKSLLSGSIAPGKSFLISQKAPYTGITADLTIDDLEMNWSYKGVGLALVKSTEDIANDASGANDPNVVDVLGFKSVDRVPLWFEGSYIDTSASGQTSNFRRKNNGTQDTGDNVADFDVISEDKVVAPRNSSN